MLEVAVIFSILAFVLSVVCFIELRAMQKSTHKIEYVNPLKGLKLNKEGFEDVTDDVQDRLSKDPFGSIM